MRLQAFPLSVKLHLSDLALIVTFTYLPALGIVTAEANHKAGNGLLASLFRADSGANTPNGANKYIGDGSFAFDAKATARPYRCDTRTKDDSTSAFEQNLLSQLPACMLSIGMPPYACLTPTCLGMAHCLS